MKLALLNQVPDLVASTDAQLLAVALSVFLLTDDGTGSGLGACERLGVSLSPLVFYEDPSAAPPDAAVFSLQGSPPTGAEGDLGYHSEDDRGRLVAPIFVRPIFARESTLFDDPWSVSVTLGHEVVELRRNPHVNAWRDRPPLPAGDEQADEVGDPVQGVGGEVEVDGANGPGTKRRVAVPNYCLDAYFDPRGKPPFDACGKLAEPFSKLPTGYRILRDRASGKTTFDFGAQVPGAIREHVLRHGRHVRRHGPPAFVHESVPKEE